MTRSMMAARVAAAVLLAGFGLASAVPASADPRSELRQQVYLTPTLTELRVQLDLVPGDVVGPTLLRTIDTDHDKFLDAGERRRHARHVATALSLRVDGRSVPLRLTGQAYDSYALLAAGSGVIVLDLIAALPGTAHRLAVSNRYDPKVRTSIQQSVVVAPHDPAAIGAIDHSSDGRVVSVSVDTGKFPPNSPTHVVPSPDNGSVSSPNITRWLLIGLGLAGIMIIYFRPRREPRRAAETDQPEGRSASSR